MKMRNISRLPLLIGMVTACSLLGCGPEKSSPTKKTAPAKIEHPNEGDIYRIVLTPQAEERLQISTAPIEKRKMPRTRTIGGQIMLPDGANVLVTAPLTGTLLLPDKTKATTAGQTVTAGQTLLHLLPLLSPEREVPTAAERVSMANAKASLVSSQIVADGDAKQSQAQVEAANIALTRAKRLFADKVGSERDVDDAQARLDVAKTALAAAQARKRLLDQLTLDADSGKVTLVTVRAPQAGMLRTVTSSVGQVVSAGASLFEIVNLKTLWVRVPVYPGLRAEIARSSNALIQELGGDSTNISVKPVLAPPTADPLAATLDMFYELPNPQGRFYPGERVEVVLPLDGEQESLVVPRAAILRDIHGVAWVYVNSAEHEFRRHRVEVHFTTEKFAVLSRGPEVGVKVVVDGAAELFGTEFGAGK